MSIDIVFTLKILILAIVAFLIITAFDEAISRFLFDKLDLNPEKSSSWLIVGLIGVVALIFLLSVFKIEAHDILGNQIRSDGSN